MHLHSENFVFNCKKAKGSTVRFSLVRYATAESIAYTNGVILFCIHGIGGCELYATALKDVTLTSISITLVKEERRPILDPLFQKNDASISEAWCLDLYSHGESLTYNKELVMSNIETCKRIYLDAFRYPPNQDHHDSGFGYLLEAFGRYLGIRTNPERR